MKNKKVLVIGGNGFIGTNISKYLLNLGYEIYSFDIHHPVKAIDGINYLIGDFFDDVCLENVISGMDVIIHSLSTVNPGNSNQRYMQGYSRDFVQTVKLCSMIVDKPVQLIFLSSGGTVYGIQENQPILETNYPLPINHYGSVKLCIESVIRTFNTQIHKKMRIARISNPYGPGQDYSKGVGFIDAALKNTINNKTIEIWGDGEVIRDYIYIDDVAGMVASLIEYDGDIDVFNVSSSEGISLNQIIESIKELGLNPKVIYKEARSVDVPKIILDNQRIKQIYNKEVCSFKEGIKKYYEYLTNNQ